MAQGQLKTSAQQTVAAKPYRVLELVFAPFKAVKGVNWIVIVALLCATEESYSSINAFGPQVNQEVLKECGDDPDHEGGKSPVGARLRGMRSPAFLWLVGADWLSS